MSIMMSAKPTVILLMLIALSLQIQSAIAQNGVSENITDPINYKGSHRKLDGEIHLQVGIGELNRAYGYLQIGTDRDSINRGGEETTLNENNQYVSNNGHLILILESGDRVDVYGFRESKVKLEYQNIVLFGVKPIKFKMEKAE